MTDSVIIDPIPWTHDDDHSNFQEYYGTDGFETVKNTERVYFEVYTESDGSQVHDFHDVSEEQFSIPKFVTYSKPNHPHLQQYIAGFGNTVDESLAHAKLCSLYLLKLHSDHSVCVDLVKKKTLITDRKRKFQIKFGSYVAMLDTLLNRLRLR